MPFLATNKNQWCTIDQVQGSKSYLLEAGLKMGRRGIIDLPRAAIYPLSLPTTSIFRGAGIFILPTLVRSSQHQLNQILIKPLQMDCVLFRPRWWFHRHDRCTRQSRRAGYTAATGCFAPACRNRRPAGRYDRCCAGRAHRHSG